MLLVTFLLAAVVGPVCGSLWSGVWRNPQGIGAGDAVAAVVYLIAFLPNMLSTIAGFSVGAPVELGGQITVAGRLRGRVPAYSVFDWDGATPPFYVALLVMIPRSPARSGATSPTATPRTRTGWSRCWLLRSSRSPSPC